MKLVGISKGDKTVILSQVPNPTREEPTRRIVLLTSMKGRLELTTQTLPTVPTTLMLAVMLYPLKKVHPRRRVMLTGPSPEETVARVMVLMGEARAREGLTPDEQDDLWARTGGPRRKRVVTVPVSQTVL